MINSQGLQPPFRPLGVGHEQPNRTAVLMTSFNRMQTTLECLEHLLNRQDYQPDTMDVYLVDDNSPDKTGDAVLARFPNVNLIRADGNHFWCGGMRLAWATAAKLDYDFYLWLNDDTYLYPNALDHLFRLYYSVHQNSNAPQFIAGSVCDPTSKKLSYGGMTWVRGLLSNTARLIEPAGRPVRCDTANGNVLLIPKGVFRRTGNMSATFSHGFGDFDYGLRAKEAGCELWVTGSFVGECEPNRRKLPCFDPDLSLTERWRSMNTPKGMPPREYAAFVSRYCGAAWPIYVAKLLARVLMPKWWQRR